MEKFSENKINNFHPHSVTGKTDDSFIGLKIVGNDIHFYYPETYRLSGDMVQARADIIDLLRTIAIAKTSSTELSRGYNTHDNDGDFALMSYLWVINDYLTNGFYINREKIFKINQSGKINWKRTLKSQPIISKGNVIYPNITVEIKNFVDNILVEIHKYCVKKSIDFIGWLFNLNSSFIETKPYNESTRALYLTTLQQELDKTFDDDKRVRLTHLRNIITGLDVHVDGKEFVYGVDSYYYIFEKMIDSIFGNVRSIKDFYPKASWQLVRNDFRETPSSDLRPDTIILDRESSTAYILDSKFYRFGYTGDESDLPETSSIQKQITYGDYIKQNIAKFKIEHIYNAFLLPYNKERETFKSGKNIQYIGYAKSTWKDNTNKHEIIHAFLIDLTHVIKTWNRHNHQEDIATLIEEIIKHNNEAIMKNATNN